MKGIRRVGKIYDPKTEIKRNKDHHMVYELKEDPGIPPEKDMLCECRVFSCVFAGLSLLIIVKIEVRFQCFSNLHRLSANDV